MPPTPRKYLFDVSCDQLDGPVPLRLAASSPESTVTRADLEAARGAAFEEGRRAALAEAAAGVEQQLAHGIEALAAGATALIARDAEIRRKAEQDAIEVLRALLRTAVPALARKDPLAEIEAVVADCLGEAFDEPRVVLRVPDGLFDAMRQRLEPIAAERGFAGKFVLLADATLGPADCRLEWADGGAERNMSRLQQDMTAILDRALAAPPTPAAPSNQETVHE